MAHAIEEGMTNFKVTPETAKRAVGLIEHHGGDLAVARHDVYIGIQSLGGYYTDRKSEAVLTLLEWLMARPTRQDELLGHLRRIATERTAS